MFKRFIKSLLLLVMITVLVGCGGGSDVKEPVTNYNILEGKVVDGEISDATVFLDLNKDGLLNDGEPYTKSDESGYFSLKVEESLAKDYTIPLASSGGYDIREKEAFDLNLIAFREKDTTNINLTPITTLLAYDVLDNIEQKNLRVSAVSENDLFTLLDNAKKDLAKLFALETDILTKDPVSLALESKDTALLETNMKITKVVREIKKGIKKELRDKKLDAIKSFKALYRGVKEAKKEIKDGDEALAEAVEFIKENESDIFNRDLMPLIKESVKYTIDEFNKAWRENKDKILEALENAKGGFVDVNEDTTPPEITINGDSNLTLEVFSEYKELGAYAVDDVDGLLDVDINGSVDSKKLGVYSVVYTAVDSSSNVASATREVRVVDTTPPTIKLIGDSEVVLNIGSSYEELGAEAIDNYDGNITNKVSIESDIDTTKAGSYSVIYTVVDSSGNKVSITRVVKVVDNTTADTQAPVITLDGDNPLTLDVGNEFIEPGYSAVDDVDVDVTSLVEVDGIVDFTKLGVYELIYKVADSSGNEANTTRVVNVVDRVSPEIKLLGDSNITLEVFDSYTELGAEAIDNYDGNITNRVSITNNVDSSKLGSYIVNYSVEDSSGNRAEIDRVVKVVDTTPPTITLLGDANVTIELNQEYQDAGVQAVDNYDGDITNSVNIENGVDSSKAGSYSVVYSVKDSSGNEASVVRGVTVIEPYSYIPKGEELTDEIAIRFLNKATFGADEENIAELKSLGVEEWLNKQFAIEATDDIYIRNMIELSKLKSSRYTYSVEEYLADNDIVYFQGTQWERISSWFQSAIDAKDQLRHKTAYNLSQIIVESDFEPLFKTRAEVLARYFDILYSNAFKSYKDVLKDITFSSGMGIFLTYRGSRAEYNNSAGVPVYPDENYAREIMQLFTIGLNELNIDGTLQGGKAIPTYTQEDVNELARVFTGWDVPRNNWKFDTNTFGRKLNLFGDLIHPMVFFQEYHDNGEKKVLGQTIPAGMDGRDEVLLVLDILMNNKNTAPYISKNLIMRFTKSNPSPEYVERVATVFRDSGGDLKEVVKAILLDPEIWEDIKNEKIVKFKEPFIGFTNFLKAFNVKPLPYWYTIRPNEEANNTRIIYDRYHFDGDKLRDYITQVPGLAPNVFNFYDNDYIPNDDNFKALNLTAPEIEIQSDSHYISFSNYIKTILTRWDKNYITNFYWPKDDGSRTYYDTVEDFIDAARTNHMYLYNSLWYGRKAKLLLDTTAELEVMEEAIDGDIDGDFKNITEENPKSPEAVEAVIKHLDMKLTGGRMNEAQFNAIYNNLKDVYLYGDDVHTKRYKALTEVIYPTIRAIVTSSLFMTE